MIKLSNWRNDIGLEKVIVSFAALLVILSIISIAGHVVAQSVFQQDNLNMSEFISNTYGGQSNSRTGCNEPIDVNDISSGRARTDNSNGQSAQSAIDNDEDTEWSENGVGAYLQLDMETVRPICEIEVLWDKGDERSYNFIVSVSENGTVFRDVMRAVSSGNSSLPETYQMPDTMAKQIRLVVYGNSEDESASIREISLNGRDVRKVGDEYVICRELPIVSFLATPNQSGDFPEKAADGDFTTTWSSLGSGSFIQADLGSLKTLCGVSIAWYNGQSREYSFEISVSNDGINFDQVFEGVSSGKSIRPQNYVFPEINANYVRITIFGNDKDDWAGITELAMKGFALSPSPPPSPPPSNKPPTADPKSVSTDMNSPVQIKLSGSDPEGSPLTYTIVDLPKHGQLSSISGDIVEYAPDKDFSGSDSFTYTVKDNEGESSIKSTVTISVDEVLECDILEPAMITAVGSDANVPSNVIDNNLNTRWSNKGIGSWIQFDLGSNMSVCSVDIAWYRGDTRQNDFGLSVSNDGSTFEKVFRGKSNGTTTGFEKYDLPSGPEGRYVRITVDGNTENDWASITEIAMFGSGSATTPEPSPAPSPEPSPAPSPEPSPPDEGGGDAGTNDKFGIKKIYATKPNGEEWYMNMENPENDPRTKSVSISKNDDGSWRVTSGQVRYGVYTSSG